MYVKLPLNKAQIQEVLEPKNGFKLTREQQDKLKIRLAKIEKQEAIEVEKKRAGYEKNLLIQLGKYPSGKQAAV